MTILEIRDLNKTFTSGSSGRIRTVHAVDSVSLSIPKESIVGLVGESGCGKSTVTRLIMGLETPDSGFVVYRGRDITALKKKERRDLNAKVQVVFQDPNASFNPKKTLAWSLSEGLLNRGSDASEIRRTIGGLIDRVGISNEDLAKFPHQLSGGQKQRLSIVRALSMGADTLLLDEPVSSLDVSIQAQMINLILELREDLGLSLLFISHDLALVGYLCDEIHVMRRGKIVESGPTERLLSAPADPYTREIFAAAPTL